MKADPLFSSKFAESQPAISTTRKRLIPCPFQIEIDPMQRLLLINFEKDPDDLYIGFEPQQFDDAQNGRGMLVIGWRRDGKVDVYHDHSLNIRPEKYGIAGKGLANKIPVAMDANSFEITDQGVFADIGFSDLKGRQVRLAIREANPRKREPFGLLAPMGDAAEKPSSLPLVLLHGFYFVRRKKTTVHIEINGKNHRPDKLPFLLDGCYMYFTRYCPDPTIATLNPAHNGPVPMAEISSNNSSSEKLKVNVSQHETGAEIKSISRRYKNREVCMCFEPAFPDLSCLKENSLTSGNFRIDEDPTVGSIRGHYTLQKKREEIQITMIPSGGWVPREKKLSLRLLYSIAGIFRNWPTTYKWTADIRVEKDGEMFMKSKWERIKS